ncbi:MAG: glycerol-3-phosphate acyltransferase, partial [Alphaproteobacteria bacterium]|nr:glycerol-3-phosphate acyltransferase [Alphaproteobacteria bacterium]
MTVILLVCALGGYLLGSVPYGLVLCYLYGYGDIRKIGSGNIGATNVLRTGNKWLALLTVLCDAFKAGIAAFLAYKLVPNIPLYGDDLGNTTTLNMLASLVAGTCGVLGHNFPVWLKFKGGKGVASSFGFILMTCWPLAVLAFGIWLVMAVLFRYSSLAALTAAVAVPLMAIFM